MTQTLFPENVAPNATKLLVDSKNVAYHAYSWALKAYDGEDVQAAYFVCFWAKIKFAARRCRTTRIAFCWDSDNSLRSKLYPAYKAQRKVVDDPGRTEMFKTFDRTRDVVLPALGFKNNYLLDGFEADDIIAKLVEQNKDKRMPLVIYSTDSDLYQLLGNNVYMINARMASDYGRLKPFTAASMHEKYGVTPADWPMVKAIAGCNSDNIPGVRGIGEKIASAYIRGEAKPMAVAKIEASMDTIKETLRLVKLPFEGTPDLEFVPDALNYDAFMRMSAEIGAISLSDDGYWKRFFNGEV